RDSPLVLDGRIDLAIGALVGDHLAAAVEADERPVIAAYVLLELHPVAAAREPFHSRPGSIPRHPPAAAELDVIAARKGELAGALLAVEPPGNIHRSEERRVGKECRSRWWTDHKKKKVYVDDRRGGRKDRDS